MTHDQAVSIKALVNINIPPEEMPHPEAGKEALNAAIRAHLAGLRGSVRVKSIGDITISTATENDLSPWKEETWSGTKKIERRQAIIRETDHPTTPWLLIAQISPTEKKILGAFPNEDMANMICEMWQSGLLPAITEDLPEEDQIVSK